MTTASHPLVGTTSPALMRVVPTTLWAMRQAARAFALRVEPSFTVSPAVAASIAIAGETL